MEPSPLPALSSGTWAASPSVLSLLSAQALLLSRLSSASSLLRSTSASLTALPPTRWTEAAKRLGALREDVADIHRTIARIRRALPPAHRGGAGGDDQARVNEADVEEAEQ